jgi:hypothetical protein
VTRRRRLLRQTGTGAFLLLVAIVGLVAGRSLLETEDTDTGVVDVLARDLPEGVPALRFDERPDLLDRPFRHFGGVRTHRLPEDMGSGIAWGDCDGDGRPDLYAVSWAAPLGVDLESAGGPASALYRNRGAGGFADIGEEAGVALRVRGMGAAWADYDGDGDLDLYVTAYGPNYLFRNDGSCRFTDVTSRAGVAGGDAFSAGATWADYDGDEDLDLYVTNYVRFADADDPADVSSQYGRSIPFTLNPSSYPAEPNFLYRNQGDGTFTEVARRAGVDNPTGRSMSAVWADFDGDAQVDLYVANDISDNAFFRNRGDGTFEDISSRSLTADYRGAMGLAVADIDRDGDLDFIVTHWLAQENALYINHISEVGAAEIFFADNAEAYGLGYTGLKFVGWGASLFDADNDGWADLFIANGSTLESETDLAVLVPQRAQMFLSRGPEGFFDVTEVWGPALVRPRVARGLAAADWDGDGDVDLALLENGGTLVLLENTGAPRGGWLAVDLEQPGANRHAVGAWVRVMTGAGSQLLAVGAAPSYLSQEPLTLHFGVGEARRIDALRVRWPDGSEEVWRDLPASRRHRLVRGTGASSPLIPDQSSIKRRLRKRSPVDVSGP